MFLLLPFAAGAEVYKCKDASGRVSYSQRPCADGRSSETIEIETDRSQAFLKKLAVLAKDGEFGDLGFVQRTLGVELKQPPKSQDPRYLEGTPAARGAARHVRYRASDHGRRGKGWTSIEIIVDFENDCINPGAFVRTFGTPLRDIDHGTGRRTMKYDLVSANGGRVLLEATFFGKNRPCAGVVEQRRLD